MHRQSRGFTLIELLVVIVIIGILMGLLIPAVEMAREGGRRAQCSNNVRQLAAACLVHLQQQGFFPTGGWGNSWTGLVEGGFGKAQPGGWIYNILPYIDEKGLHDLTGDAYGSTANIATRIQTPLAVLHCPSRRRAILYPAQPPNLPVNDTDATHPYHNQCPEPLFALWGNQWTSTSAPPSAMQKVAKNDYAINGGSEKIDNEYLGKSDTSDPYDSMKALDHGAGPYGFTQGPGDISYKGVPSNLTGGALKTQWPSLLGPILSWMSRNYPFAQETYPDPDRGDPFDPTKSNKYTWHFNGLSHALSQVTEGQVTDGMSNTYLVGEKYISANHYLDGNDDGDNEHAYTGDDGDVIRWARNPALPQHTFNYSSPFKSRAGFSSSTDDDTTDPLDWQPASDSSVLASNIDQRRGKVWGSAHRAGFYMSFCDGSVKLISYAIDLSTHEYLGSRNDHKAVNAASIR